MNPVYDKWHSQVKSARSVSPYQLSRSCLHQKGVAVTITSMTERLLLPKKGLSANYMRFIDEWKIGAQGIAVASNGVRRALNVWHGEYVEGETVVIAEGTSTELGHIVSVGIAEWARYCGEVLAGTADGDFYADVASHVACRTVQSAIYLLNIMKGLPDGFPLTLQTPPELTS